MKLEKMVDEKTDERIKPEYYFDLTKFRHNDIFAGKEYVWDALKNLDVYINDKLKELGKGDRSGVKQGVFIDDNVYLGKGTVVDHGAVIHGPTIIGDGCEIRAGAKFRGSVLVGDGAILGGEFKSSILFDEADVPHNCYVGNSIIGYQTNLAAGVVTSPHNFNWTPLIIEIEGNKYETGMVKFGSIVGDKTTVGSNCVLNPASFIGPNSIVYPNVSWRGFCPKNTIVKLKQEHTIIERDMSVPIFRDKYMEKKKHLYE